MSPGPVPVLRAVSALIAAEAAGDTLSEVELLTTCGLLFVAGHEITVNLVGNGMLALLRHPVELRTLRENPRLVAGAVEELLRYDTPVQRAGRIPNADVEIGGTDAVLELRDSQWCRSAQSRGNMILE